MNRNIKTNNTNAAPTMRTKANTISMNVRRILPLALLAITGVNGDVQAQFDCTLPEHSEAILGGEGRGMTCDGNNPNINLNGDFDLKYSRPEAWIPDGSTPEIIIPIAIHIFQDALGGGTFTDVPAPIRRCSKLLIGSTVFGREAMRHPIQSRGIQPIMIHGYTLNSEGAFSFIRILDIKPHATLCRR
ncbi:MAG TPA: hypothetical protein PL002_15950 [Flavobacteriales bacterium]|nr:hypothetical protein [Flavobacteriales bacterium]HNO06799.1 hypothetical protein [Flavobacteriales bacterium]